MSESLAVLPALLSAQLRLSLAALVAGVALGVPIGVLATRLRPLDRLLRALSALFQTIPALALLAVMVPLLAALRQPSRGVWPALLGLLLYDVCALAHSALEGLRGLDPTLLEAARAVGMSRRQRLWRVELPLALPGLVAGLRAAAVWTVGMATLSTVVGATSLGDYIFAGLQARNATAVLVGCAAALALALALDGLLRLAESGLRRRRHWLVALAGLALVSLGTWAGLPLARAAATAAPRVVRVGAKTSGEQHLLAEIVAGTVRSRTGRRAATAPSLGSSVALDALRRDEIDLYVEYTGALWSTVMGRAGAGESRQQVLDEVRTWLRDNGGVTLAAPLGFENAYRFTVRRDTAGELHLSRLSDLTVHAPRLSLASDFEFFLRADWRALRSAYALTFHEQRTMDPSQLFQAIATRQADVITASSSDGRISPLDLVTLEDERHVMPPYDAVVLAGPRLAREWPEVVVAVGKLQGSLDLATMRRLNKLVEVDNQDPAAVARDFLAEHEAAPATPRPSVPPPAGPRVPQRRSQPTR